MKARRPASTAMSGRATDPGVATPRLKSLIRDKPLSCVPIGRSGRNIVLAGPLRKEGLHYAAVIDPAIRQSLRRARAGGPARAVRAAIRPPAPVSAAVATTRTPTAGQSTLQAVSKMSVTTGHAAVQPTATPAAAAITPA